MTDATADLENVDQSVCNRLIENHPLPVLLTAGEGHPEYERNDILYANDAFLEMTGYTREELFREKPKILQGPKTHEQLKDYMSEKLRDGEHFIGETVNYRKDGEEYSVRLSIDPIDVDDDGEVTHWVSVQEEVTTDALTRGFDRD